METEAPIGAPPASSPDAPDAPDAGRLGAKILGVLASGAIVALSLPALARFVELALARLRYPFELEWMEGGVATHVRVALSGHALYGPPSLDFTPFIYAPFYYYVSALVSALTGPGYLAPRLVSTSAILACFVLIGWWVRRETEDAVAGLAAACAFSATYAVTGFWFDVARVDSLYLLLILVGYALVRFGETPRSAAIAGLVLALAFFTKQSGLALAFVALVSLGFRSVRLGLVAAGVFGALALGGFVLFDHASNGWLHFYLFTVPADHEIFWDTWQATLTKYFWTPVVPMASSAVAVTCGVGLGRGVPRSRWFFYGSWIMASASTSLVYLLHTGGYPNVLLPAYAAFAVAFGIALAAVRPRGAPAETAAFGRGCFAVAVVALQGVLLSYDAAQARPTATDVAEGTRAIRELGRLPKPLWITASSYYSVLAGQPETVTHTMGLVDVLKAGGPVATKLHAELETSIRAHRFKTIVVDRAFGFLPPDLVYAIKSNYHQTGALFKNPGTRGLWPKSGAEVRPDEVWQAN
ncbi:MAG TPA: hypothetical protein VF395_08780 [Polyangiaceae bacterium]